MTKLEELKSLIKSESDKLICETHPETCLLRDENYPHFEQIVLSFIFQDDEPTSAQTAFARLEQSLGEAFT